MSACGTLSFSAGMQPALFALDVLVTVATAWLMVCGSGHARHGALEALLAWIWSVVALVAGAGMVLGVGGGFGAVGFGVAHVVLLGAALLWRGRHLQADREALVRWWRQLDAAVGPERGPRLIAGGLGVLLAGLALLAVFTEPAVMDALNYHLPRLGHWLQDGRIRMIGAGDERLDYIAGLAEVVMAWLLGPVRDGFVGVVVLQAIGGLLAVGATIGLARRSGLRRTGALLAGGLLLGMGNVVTQFTAAQTDLFTTGVFAAAFYLWLVALQRGRASVPGAMGAGLALGAKGTVFYLTPAAVLWVAGLAWQHRMNGRQWARTLLAGIVGVGLFAGPGLWRNWQAYGDVRGPVHWIREFHPELPSLAAKAEKLRLNALSFLAQDLEPDSQPAGCQALARSAGEALVALLPAADPYTFLGQDRRAGLDRALQRSAPDADLTAFGGLTLLLFTAGSGLALVRVRQRSAWLVLGWSAGVWIFFLYFNVLHQWHPFSFRYYVLVAPWMAVVSAWGIEQVKGWWRHVLWAVIVVCALEVGGRVTLQTHQSGWQTIVSPERTIGYYVAQGWREWSQQLDHPGDGFLLGLPDDRPLAAFYRQTPRRNVRLVPAQELARASTVEELMRDQKGWLILPAAQFTGREGRVAARSWLFHGEERDPYSVVAYRSLAPGERPRPFFYRQRWSVQQDRLWQELLVKTFADGRIRLRVANPTAENRDYTWTTPLAQGRGTLPAHGQAELLVPVPPNAVAEVRLGFGEGSASMPAKPAISLAE